VSSCRLQSSSHNIFTLKMVLLALCQGRTKQAGLYSTVQEAYSMTYIKFTGSLWGRYLLVSLDTVKDTRENLVKLQKQFQECFG
jgi:hypothetical protein